MGHYRDRPIPSNAPWSERRKGTHEAPCGAHVLGVEGVGHRTLRFDGIVAPYQVVDALELHSQESFPEVCPPRPDASHVFEATGSVCNVNVLADRCPHFHASESYVIQVTSEKGTFNLGRFSRYDQTVQIAEICATATVVEQPVEAPTTGG
jgi:hypothetical protein